MQTLGAAGDGFGIRFGDALGECKQSVSKDWVANLYERFYQSQPFLDLVGTAGTEQVNDLGSFVEHWDIVHGNYTRRNERSNAMALNRAEIKALIGQLDVALETAIDLELATTVYLLRMARLDLLFAEEDCPEQQRASDARELPSREV
jgi:hypothetical protein